jgi:hypothetical protein
MIVARIAKSLQQAALDAIMRQILQAVIDLEMSVCNALVDKASSLAAVTAMSK